MLADSTDIIANMNHERAPWHDTHLLIATLVLALFCTSILVLEWY